MREFAFELRLSAHLEATREAVVSRQLGGGVADPGGRVLDTVLVEPGPEFDRRARITPATIPPAAIESDVGPGRARYWKRAFENPDRAERIVERAVERGFFESERRNGRRYVRQVTRYPNWFDRIVGIENKPDLGSPGALETQLRTDVSLGLVDRVVLATESYVTRAHLNRIPDAVEVWRFHPNEGSVEVVREGEDLPVTEPGVELLERHPGHDEIAVVSAEEKRRARVALAERAYGKGIRTYEFPDCKRIEDAEIDGGGGFPYCAWKGRLVDPGEECGPDCPGHEPADPPEIDPDAERDRRTPWRADPEGLARRQAGLDRFE